jgi:hypothetical protein
LITNIPHNARIHELVRLPLRLDDGDVQRLTELRGGESDPWSSAHRMGQIIEQGVQQFAETLNGGAREAEPRITEEQDWSNTHSEILASATGASLDPHRP